MWVKISTREPSLKPALQPAGDGANKEIESIGIRLALVVEVRFKFAAILRPRKNQASRLYTQQGACARPRRTAAEGGRVVLLQVVFSKSAAPARKAALKSAF